MNIYLKTSLCGFMLLMGSSIVHAQEKNLQIKVQLQPKKLQDIVMSREGLHSCLSLGLFVWTAGLGAGYFFDAWLNSSLFYWGLPLSVLLGCVASAVHQEIHAGDINVVQLQKEAFLSFIENYNKNKGAADATV